jgi:hypothetical protein
MPKFGLDTQYVFSEREDWLQVVLEEDEDITDEILNSIDFITTALGFTRRYPNSKKPVRLLCSPEGFGRLRCLQRLYFFAFMEPIDDAIFSELKCLELVHFAGSVSSLFTSTPVNLMKQPIRMLRLNGYNLVHMDEKLQALVDKVERVGGKVEHYV